jgi:glucose-6-phosphate 1-epimerase
MGESPLAGHVVSTMSCTGEVFDQGAQVLRWAPEGHHAVLFAADGVTVRPGCSPHAGIPVCFPWFGPGRRPGMTPPHGFVRTVPWRLVARIDGTRGGDGGDGGTEESGGVTFIHEITDAEATSAHWPYRYRTRLRSSLGRALAVSLTVDNTGAEPFDIEEALHAYLAVGDIRQIRLEGLDGVGFHDKVTGADRVQRGHVSFAGETDAVYRTSDPVVVVDPVLGRRLRVSREGSANVVVWNPWRERAADYADIGDDWAGLVCVEAANALDNAVTLEPGQSHTLAYHLGVELL